MFNRPPLANRRGIDFFTEKSEAAFRNDPYERYWETVVRQLALHYADTYWGAYPFQPVVDWISQQLPTNAKLSLLDVGCGVGRLLSEVSRMRPDWELSGIDYSYNLLRSCHQLCKTGQNIELDYQERGLPKMIIHGKKIPQLQLGLSKADQLPLANNSIDVIMNTFLLDRLEEPEKALAEWYRVLRPGGCLLVVSPLNWQTIRHWQSYAEASSVYHLFEQNNWSVVNSQQFSVQEPLDANRNYINWQLRCWVLTPVL